MTPKKDFEQSIASLEPAEAGDYVFVSTTDYPEGLTPFATVAEPEGMTVVMALEDAPADFLADNDPYTRITLGAYTPLDSVGITAIVAQTLASRGIPCNVIAGKNHDYLFVPQALAGEAMRVLRHLVKQAEGWLENEPLSH